LDNVDSQCCKPCHSLNEFSSNFQSSMIVVHYINVRMHESKSSDTKSGWTKRKLGRNGVCELIAHPHLQVQAITK
jgi:hypothetical protein